MKKGYVEIDNKIYHFDEITGRLLNYKDNYGRILFIGDSRTVDMLFNDNDGIIINELYDDIVVYARHGHGFNYLKETIEEYGLNSFDTLISWMGANDKGIFDEYELYYEYLLSLNKNIILCTVGPTKDEYLESNDYSNNNMKKYNESLINFSNKYNIHVIDLYSYIIDNQILIKDDGIHYLPKTNYQLLGYIVGDIEKK